MQKISLCIVSNENLDAISNINKLFVWEHPNNKRYYAAQMQQDLFNDWIVNIYHGTIGTHLGRRRTIYCENKDIAFALIEKIEKQRIKKGYLLKNKGI